MSKVTTHHLLAKSLPPGVDSIAHGDDTMVVRFRDGTEVTVVRSFLAWMGDETFELWVPPVERTGTASLMPKLTKQQVIDHLCRMADEIAKRTA